MKSSIMKKVLAICVVAAMSAVTFGCSSGQDESRETISPSDTKQELQFFYNQGQSIDSTEAAETEGNESTADSAEDTTPAETVSETEIVTEVVTEYVAVTDAEGQQVTEADGVVQTEVQTEVHTEVVTVTVTPTEGDASQTETSAPADEYTPSYDTCTAYWLDMSQQSDFTFNGEFLVIEFLINEDTPDGSYPITLAEDDFGSWELVTRVPELISGEIVVGDGEIAEQPDASDDAFTLKANSVSGEQGETVKLVIDLSNNPGFCGFVLDIQYDANALTIAKTYGGSDFDAAVNYIK